VSTDSRRAYHHGDLRRALLDEAAEVIAANGTANLSLRDLARRLGVSHAAPAHHFGDKIGLLSALAAEGFRLLGRDSEEAFERTGSFLEVGVAYVRFALDHPAHFEVMFRPDLHHVDDPELTAARAFSASQLFPPAALLAGEDPSTSRTAGLAAWALVHGLASLALNGALPAGLDDDPERLTRSVASYLFGGHD
jgi:AcrR family transcriptional regulator